MQFFVKRVLDFAPLAKNSGWQIALIFVTFHQGKVKGILYKEEVNLAKTRTIGKSPGHNFKKSKEENLNR